MNDAVCDTIWDTCGYWAYEYDNKTGLKTFYAFFDVDVIGKGFSLEVDRINTTGCDSLFYLTDYDSVIKELFSQNPVDIEKTKPRWFELGITNIKIVSDTIIPYKIEITDTERRTYAAWLRGDCNGNGQLIRHIDFLNEKDE